MGLSGHRRDEQISSVLQTEVWWTLFGDTDASWTAFGMADSGPALLLAGFFCSPGFVATRRKRKNLREQPYILQGRKNPIALHQDTS